MSNDFPVIARLEPAGARGGADVAVAGTGFGDEPGVVELRPPRGPAVAAETTQWTAERIAVRLPGLAAFGSAGPLELTVTTADGAVSAPAPFVLHDAPPAISAVEPAVAQVEGREIAVSGARFGRPGAGQRLLLAGRPLAAGAWAPERVVATLPSGPGVGGRRTLVVETPWGSSGGVEYAVRELPRIASVSPAEAAPGDAREIRGSGFGTDRHTVFMRAAGAGTPPVNVEVAGWQDTAITVRVPPVDHLGGDGPVEVLVETEVDRSGAHELMLLEPNPPELSAILPEGGQAEEREIVLTGTGFGRRHGRAGVVFAAPRVRAPEVLAWSRTELRLRVPSVEALHGAGVKQVFATTPWGDSPPRPYEVGELPKIQGLSNENVPPGAFVTLTGRAFGPRAEGRLEIVTIYPMIAQAWRRDWEHITPFLALPEDLRRVVYTTNTIEAMHRQIRKAIKTRGHFPDEQAATKLIYLAIERAETKWRSVRAWTSGLAALKIHFGDRLPD